MADEMPGLTPCFEKAAPKSLKLNGHSLESMLRVEEGGVRMREERRCGEGQGRNGGKLKTGGAKRTWVDLLGACLNLR